MNENLIPNDYYLVDLGLRNLFENTIAINFNHRWLATLTFILIICLALYLKLSKNYKNINFAVVIIITFAILQFSLGILTLITNVKIYLASMHQINSILLLSSLLFTYHKIKQNKEI